MDKPFFVKGFHQHGHTARFAEILGDILAARFEGRDVRRLLEDFGDILELELDATLIRHGRQVQGSIGRSARCGDNNRSVFKGFAGADITRAQICLDEAHHRLAGFNRIFVAIGVRGWQGRRERQGQPDGF